MNDRYLQAGLKSNPFIAAPMTGPPSETFVSRGLPDPPTSGENTLIQVIGEQGYGKSTHIHYWRSLQDGPYHYIPKRPYRQRWVQPPVEAVTYGDEIDRMPKPLRLRWFQRLSKLNATLIIGTHKDLEPIARKAGFTTVTTHHLEPMNKETFSQVVQRRLDFSSAQNGQPVFTFSETDLDYIFSESGGVPREADAVCHRLLAERLT